MHLAVSNDFCYIKNHTTANKIFDFISTDSYENYEKNKKTIGENWYYYDKKIEYKYNSWGYRAKEFDELDDDYILTFGCSNTEGIGLLYDEIWANKIAKKLNLDLFNMGTQSTSVDFQFYNTLLLQNFFKKNKKLPKLVIYQWPSDHRTAVFYKEIHDNEERLVLNMISPHFNGSKFEDFFKWYKIGFIENQGELEKQSFLYPLFCNSVWTNLNIPVVNWTYHEDKLYNFKNEMFKIYRFIDDTKVLARDCSHNGHIAQDKICEMISSILEKEKIFI